MYNKIIIGHTTSSQSSIWVKAMSRGKWWLVVSKTTLKGVFDTLGNQEVDSFLTEQNIHPVFQSSMVFTENTGLTGTFQVTPLEASAQCFYALVASNEIAGLQGAARVVIGATSGDYFRTLPAVPQDFTFGFYSCNDSEKSGQNLWQHFFELLKDKNALFVIGGGDQIYADSSGEKYNIWKIVKKNKQRILHTELYKDENGNLKPDEIISNELINHYRLFYQSYWQDEYLNKVYSRFPQYMIWDDHEIMDGWGSLTKKARGKRLNALLQNDDSKLNIQLSNIVFKAAVQAYNEFQHAHNPPYPEHENNVREPDTCIWDYHYDEGLASFYVLDLRGHHDVEAADGERLLGSKQKKRFEDWISSQDAAGKKALFIVSSVPVAHWKEGFANVFDIAIGNWPAGQDDFRDEWGHATNRTETGWLLELLLRFSEQRKQKIVILSGDVHAISLFKIRNNAYPNACLYNLTSSGISRKPSPLALQLEISDTNSKLKGFPGTYVDKRVGHTYRNNFACISVKEEDEDVKIVAEFYYYKKSGNQLKSIRESLD